MAPMSKASRLPAQRRPDLLAERDASRRLAAPDQSAGGRQFTSLCCIIRSTTRTIRSSPRRSPTWTSTTSPAPAEPTASRGFYVVTPVKALQKLALKIIDHWEVGYGSQYNVTRKEALALARIRDNSRRRDDRHRARSRRKAALIVVTSARPTGQTASLSTRCETC